MYERPNYFAIVFTELLILGKGLTIAYLIGQGIYDPKFFTYFTYTLLYAFYGLAMISYSSLSLMQFVYSFLFIPMLGIVAFVAFAIIVIVGFNDWVMVRTTFLGGGDRTLGQVHTGDFIMHSMPLVGMLTYTLVHNLFIGLAFDGFWRSLRRGQKVLYLIYLYLAPLLVLWLYMRTMPFDDNYPTSFSKPIMILLSTGLSALVQTVIILIAFFALRPQDYNRHKLLTPTGLTYRFGQWNHGSISTSRKIRPLSTLEVAPTALRARLPSASF